MNLDDKLRSLVKRYKPKPGDISFRNSFDMAVSDAVHRAGLDRDEGDRLVTARRYMEEWSNERPPEPRIALGQWYDLYHANWEERPDWLLRELLKRFPKRKGVKLDWAPLLLDPGAKPMIEALISRRVLGLPELRRVAKSKPYEFYFSPALDVLLERDGGCPRQVWKDLSQKGARPRGLMSKEEALVRAYAAEASADAMKWLLKLFTGSPEVRIPFVRRLLIDGQQSLRFACSLIAALPRRASRRSDGGITTHLIKECITVCETLLQESGGMASNASVMLSVLNLAATMSPDSVPRDVADALNEATNRYTEPGVLKALRIAETGEIEAARKFAFIATGEVLYRVIQTYLRTLPGAGSGLPSEGRAVDFERYLGRKEVIEQLLLALDTDGSETQVRDAVEVALFNVDVRSLGEVGQATEFDAHLHEAMSSGILPGDPVVVVTEGRMLGGGEDAIVLTKARVTVGTGNGHEKGERIG